MGNTCISDIKKLEIEGKCKPLIEKFKALFVAQKPNKEFIYIVDIYYIWIKNILYFCEKYQNDNANKSEEKEFEVKFAKLTFRSNDSFDLYYFRQSDSWVLVEANLPLNKCLKLIEDLPNLHP